MLRLAAGLAALLLVPAPAASTPAATTSAVPDVVLAAAGDLGARAATARSLARLDRSNAEAFVALGDLSYGDVSPEQAWCDYVTDRLPVKGPQFPFELLAGNHEDDHGPDGHISSFAECLPDRLASRGRYAAQYSFDLPAADPLVRVVLVSPRLTVDGHTYDYRRGTADRAWLAGQVRDARADGVPWVVLGMHYPCLSTGVGHPGCASGRAVHKLALRLGVDLLLAGHNHVYERSKQLALSAECPRIPRRYDAGCVADHGKDGAYTAGAGTVQVTAGRFGGRPMSVDASDPDRPWFVKAAGGTTGYLRLRATPDLLAARYVAVTGRVRDAFTIAR